MEKFDLPVEDLLLDLENPRIGAATNQSNALNSIIDLSLDHFRTMMKSIKDNGLDPGDSLYVISEESSVDGYTVVDGNRRISALKVLFDPTILQGTSLPSSIVKQLTSIAQDFDPKKFGAVSVVLFDTREAANDWILRRHGRGLDGEGRIGWNPLETQRFQNDWTVLDILDFVERNSSFTADLWPTIRAAVFNNSSTLRRFIDAKSARDWLGIEVIEKGGARIPGFKSDTKFALNVLSQIFHDISINKINSRSYNKASEISGYFDALPDDLHPDDAHTGPLKLFRNETLEDDVVRPRNTQPKRTPKPPQKTTKPKPPRATLAPTRHAFNQPQTIKGQELLREASKIKLIDYPLACAYILRAFLEHTVDTYMTAHDMPFWENQKQLELSIRASRVLDHIQNSGIALAKDLKGVRRTLTTKADPASIQALNDYHHNKYQIPGIDILRDAWDSAEPLFIAVYGTP